MLRELLYASYCVTINTGVFPGKMCLDRHKSHSCGHKKPEGTSSAIFLASGPLQNTANSSIVPTEFTAELTTKIKSLKANW